MLVKSFFAPCEVWFVLLTFNHFNLYAECYVCIFPKEEKKMVDVYTEAVLKTFLTRQVADILGHCI